MLEADLDTCPYLSELSGSLEDCDFCSSSLQCYCRRQTTETGTNYADVKFNGRHCV